MNTNSTPTKKELLQAESDLLHVAVEIAFRQRLISLLNNPNCDPNLLVEMMKLNEKREAQKLKERQADLKEKDQERFADRRMTLQEHQCSLDYRELTYREKKLTSQAKQKAEAAAKKSEPTEPTEPTPVDPNPITDSDRKVEMNAAANR